MTLTTESFAIDLAFWILSICTVISAIAVIQIQDLFRSALFLIVTFLGVAGLFILLGAEFLAGVQLMVYVGAISVLIIFAILMTRDLEEGNPSHSFRLPVAIVAIIFILFAYYIITQGTDWNGRLISENLDAEQQKVAATVFFKESIPSLARMLLTDFVLAFEMVSVLLLAAALGALALVRDR
ncbi:MAG: NADH-quinone oxidoreductase subunit J [SAR202 cluster bacterium]|nr:NADH-quinone oxidoreductase subunit J [SAR202 cluster bacterium]